MFVVGLPDSCDDASKPGIKPPISFILPIQVFDRVHFNSHVLPSVYGGLYYAETNLITIISIYGFAHHMVSTCMWFKRYLYFGMIEPVSNGVVFERDEGIGRCLFQRSCQCQNCRECASKI